MELGLNKKTVFVTGSSGGIGRAIAIAFAKEGARVVVQYNSDESGAHETVSKFPKDAESLILGGDVSDSEAVTKWFAEIDQRFGSLDILINNAGIDGDRKNIENCSDDDWGKVISINLSGSFYCFREAIRRMRLAGKGVIISVTSVHEVIPWAGHAAYCAAKAGIAMMTKSVALEVAESGIRVLCLAPGAIKTEINEDVWSDPDHLEDLESKIPMRRMGEVEEIANLAVVLASPSVGSYVQGTSITADGGMECYSNFSSGG